MSKPKLVQVTGDELSALHNREDIGTPMLFSNRVGSLILFWADADELRAWRDTRSTHQSEVAK